VADEALLLLRVDTNIALAGLASGMTMPIRAEYGRGVHDAPPGCAGKHRHEKYVWTSVCLTTSPLHGLVQSYQTRENRTITVDFQNEAPYFQLLDNGKAFLECVLAFVLSLGFQLKHKATCDGGGCLTRHSH
jgi:hypothetical protein